MVKTKDPRNQGFDKFTFKIRLDAHRYYGNEGGSVPFVGTGVRGLITSTLVFQKNLSSVNTRVINRSEQPKLVDGELIERVFAFNYDVNFVSGKRIPPDGLRFPLFSFRVCVYTRAGI